MKRLWTWLRGICWFEMIGVCFAIIIAVLFMRGMILYDMANPPLKATTCNCTQIKATHAAEVERLHNRNERNLTELIIAREQLKIREQLDMDGFVETTSPPSPRPHP